MKAINDGTSLMKTVISGDITIYNPTAEVASWIEDTLTMQNPLYKNLMRRGQIDTIKRKHVSEHIKCFVKRANSLIVPFGLLRALWPMVKKGEWETDLSDNGNTTFAGLACNCNLMGYQKEAVSALLDAKGGILKAGCGSGKTYIGIELLRRIGKRFLWLCGKGDLLSQTMRNFNALYPELDVGTITEGEVHMGRDGTISTVQTMINVDYRLYQNEFDVVVVDECHNVTSDPATRQMYAKVLARCKARYKYGLTATPTRQDGLVRMIYAYIGVSPRGTFYPTHTVKDSETQSLRAKYETFDLDTTESWDYLLPDGTIDFNAILEYLQNNVERTVAICRKTADLVEEGRKVALLTSRRDHAYSMLSTLKKMGVSCGCVTGETKKRERRDTLGNPDDWDVIVSTVQLFKEGLDIKALDTVFIALPFKDAVGIQQSEGRAERPMEGKKDPLFVFAFDKNLPYCQQAEKKMRRVVNRRRT